MPLAEKHSRIVEWVTNRILWRELWESWCFTGSVSSFFRRTFSFWTRSYMPGQVSTPLPSLYFLITVLWTLLMSEGSDIYYSRPFFICSFSNCLINHVLSSASLIWDKSNSRPGFSFFIYSKNFNNSGLETGKSFALFMIDLAIGYKTSVVVPSYGWVFKILIAVLIVRRWGLTKTFTMTNWLRSSCCSSAYCSPISLS